MKKILALLVSLFMLTSCETYVSAQSPFEYYCEYSYNNMTYPVIYMRCEYGYLPHYYYGGRWLIIPQLHYRYITHYDRPRYIYNFERQYRPSHYILKPNGYYPNPRRTPNYRPHNYTNPNHYRGGNNRGTPNTHMRGGRR